ncbi:MAG: anti-sigma factor [Pseudomonadota bacterium]
MNTDNERLLELLAQQAIEPLSKADQEELSQLLEQVSDTASDDLELAVAAAWQTFASQELMPEEAPASLKAKLQADADIFFAGAASNPISQSTDLRSRTASVTPIDAALYAKAENYAKTEKRSRGPLWAAVSGWAIAAGLALVLVWGLEISDSAGPSADLVELLANKPETKVYPWGVSELEGYENVTGNVTWNSSLQQGFLRLSGMPTNDPAATQYQLWIVDPARDEEPVDGGVFDIAVDGEIIVPIDAKLLVSSPAAFAITREQPGGVVVSEGPLLVVATTG